MIGLRPTRTFHSRINLWVRKGKTDRMQFSVSYKFYDPSNFRRPHLPRNMANDAEKVARINEGGDGRFKLNFQ